MRCIQVTADLAEDFGDVEVTQGTEEHVTLHLALLGTQQGASHHQNCKNWAAIGQGSGKVDEGHIYSECSHRSYQRAIESQ